MFKSNRTFFAVALLVIQTAAAAQNSADSVRQLDEARVFGNLHRYKEVIPVQRLSGEKLEALSSFSVADAIRYFAGVQIKDYGGIGGLKTVDIRSMGTNHLGVFYDGIEIGNAQNGTVDLGRFSLDFIEEISLYNGQKSEIFQSAKDFGSAGTVYLRTRRPRFTGNRRTNLLAYFRGGSFDLANPSILWEQKISKSISSSFNIEQVYASGKYRFRHTVRHNDGSIANDTSAIRQNGDVHSLRMEGGFNGTLGSDGRWQLKGYFYDSQKGLPGAIVGNIWKNSQRQWDRTAFVQGSFQKQLARNYELLINAKYSNDRMRYLNPDTTLMLIDNRFHQDELYISMANKYSISPHWDVDLSADYIWNTLDANLTNFVRPVRSTVLIALATSVEWRRLKAMASLLGTFVFDDVRAKDAYRPEDKAEYTPAVFVSYKPFEGRDLNFRAFYKRIFRMPTFNDLYYTDIGSIKLKPEYTAQYNLGVQYSVEMQRLVESLQIRADAYYNEVIDKIVATAKGGSGGGSLYRWMMENLGYVEIRGLDVSAQIGWNLPAGIRVNTNLNYTYQKAQNYTTPRSAKEAKWYGGQINYIPWHSGSAIVNAQWRSWDANYSFIYVGERYHVSADIPANYERPWYTHDLTLGKGFRFQKLPKVKIKLSAEVNNILDQQFEVITCYPMPGRNFKVILKVEL